MSTRTMSIVFRWSAPLVLAASFGAAALAPSTAHAQNGDHLARVIVDVADVIFRGDTAYDRRGQYGPNDRLIVSRDRYGRPVYYREDPRYDRSGPPYGNAPGHQKKVKCDSHGRCQVKNKGRNKGQYYYDARHDRHHDRRDDDRYYSRYRDDDRRHDRRRDD
ncbi:MAG: hypothetical protein M3414_06785 [Pseudomonadota bacterium]|nr:hypothetical protein [Pseudomonadota bacterium]